MHKLGLNVKGLFVIYSVKTFIHFLLRQMRQKHGCQNILNLKYSFCVFYIIKLCLGGLIQFEIKNIFLNVCVR